MEGGTGCWYLVNASPDFSVQVRSFPELQPRLQPPRNTPIAAVMLTNADLDHLLGLFSLREAGSATIYASSAVRTTLESSLGLESILNSFGKSQWYEPALDFTPLSAAPAERSLSYRAIPLPGKPPPFAKLRPGGVQSLAYQFHDPITNGRLLVAPDVAAVTADLQEALEQSDVVLFDGTFWSAGELAGLRPNAPKAAEMGHLTIQEQSLELLAKLPARRKIYIHINNTNPILAPGSPERNAVEAAGITVGWDGLEFEL